MWLEKNKFFPELKCDEQEFLKKRRIELDEKEKALLEYLGIPEEEWNFLAGLELEKIPEKYRNIQERLKNRGIKIELLNDPASDRRVFLRKAGTFALFKHEDDELIKRHIKQSYGGLYIKFPADLKIEETLYIPALKKFSYVPCPHTYIEFQRNSSGNVILGTPVPRLINSPYYFSTVEIILREKSSADVVLIHSFPEYIDARIYLRARLEEGSKLNIVLLNFQQNRQTAKDIKIEQFKESILNLSSLVLSHSGTMYHEWIEVHQKESFSDSTVKVRMMNLPNSRTYNFSLVKAFKGAQNSSAFIDIKGLPLGKEDSIIQSSLPGFETEEENVEMTHTAHIGPLDEKATSYLQARGFDEKSISFLLAKAYIEEGIYRFLPKWIYETVLKYIEFVLR